VSIGGFWAAPTPVVRQPGNLGMNAQFARVAAPLVPPKEGEPLWIGIGKFGRLELSTDAILPDSDQPVPDQLWLVETGLTHIRPLARGGTLGGGFTVEALASWLFDRELFQGTNFSSGRTDVVEFGAGPALSLQLLWRR